MSVSLIDNHVNVEISKASGGISRASFGTAALLSYSPTLSGVKSYSGPDEVGVDFPASGASKSPEHEIAIAYFSQTFKPEKLKIFKGSNAPTKNLQIIPVITENSKLYECKVSGKDITPTLCQYTSDIDATLQEICDGMAIQLNAVVGKNYTATSTGTVVDIVSDAAGNYFIVEPDTSFQTKDNTPDSGIAADLAAMDAADSDWYFLLTQFNSAALIESASNWVEAKCKIYFADNADSDVKSGVLGSGDIADTLHQAAKSRTVFTSHSKPSQHISAAWVGEVSPKTPGAVTWKFKKLKGVTGQAFSTTERANLVAKNANFYEKVHSTVSFVAEGTAASGQFIDVVRGVDKLDDAITKEVLGLLVSADKVPLDDSGIAQIEMVVRSELLKAEEEGLLVKDQSSVTVPLAKNLIQADKAIRKLSGIVFAGKLAGAVHTVIPLRGKVIL